MSTEGFFQGLKNQALRQAHAVAEAVTPTLTTTKFAETGVLTPSEFVLAGDKLSSVCPPWQWDSGEPALLRGHLPKEKQYLVTRAVPSRRRVAEYLADMRSEAHGKEETVDDGSWIAMGVSSKASSDQDAQGDGGQKDAYESVDDDDVLTSNTSNAEPAAPPPPVVEEEDDYIDVDDLVDDSVRKTNEEAALPSSSISASNAKKEGSDAGRRVQRTRTYDLYITYDKYYQTPRMWLSGWDENGAPLPPNKILEDVSPDYVHKTATIEVHPHLSKLQCASIHPCRHAAILKKIFDNMDDNGAPRRVDQTLFVFLKFLQSVLPTIEFDFTTNFRVKRT